VSDEQPVGQDPSIPEQPPVQPLVQPAAPAVPPAVWPSAPAAPPTDVAATYGSAPVPPPVPPYAPPPGADFAPPVYAANPQTSSNAIIALILAVVSWAVCPLIPAIVALVFAANAGKEIAAAGGRLGGAGLVTAAKIVAWINIGFYAALIVVGGFMFALLAIAGASS